METNFSMLLSRNNIVVQEESARGLSWAVRILAEVLRAAGTIRWKSVEILDKDIIQKVEKEKIDITLPEKEFKIGKVQRINFNPNNTKELLVDIVIENDVVFPKTSMDLNTIHY